MTWVFYKEHSPRGTLTQSQALGSSLLFRVQDMAPQTCMLQQLLSAGINPDFFLQNQPHASGQFLGERSVARVLVGTAGTDEITRAAEDVAISMLLDGTTPLCAAVGEGQLGAVRILISASASPNKPDRKGWTSIYYAAEGGYTEILRCLVEAGADLNPETDRGWTPLGIAAYHGHMGCLRVLVTAGADINYAIAKAAPGQPTTDGGPPLTVAAALGRLEVVRFLLESGAETELEDTGQCCFSHRFSWNAQHKYSWNSWRVRIIDPASTHCAPFAYAEAVLLATCEFFGCCPNPSKLTAYRQRSNSPAPRSQQRAPGCDAATGRVRSKHLCIYKQGAQPSPCRDRQ